MADEGLGVPESYRQGAEEVRAHLVSLRGGAPFLSSADAVQLVRWFDAGVSVGEILRALERAHAARRKSRSRTPLGLGQAKRHLGRPTVGAMPTSGGVTPRPEDGPLAPLVAVVRHRAQDDPQRPELECLASALASLRDTDPDALVRGALAAIRAFRGRLWDHAPPARQAAARAAARAELADLLPELDEPTAAALVEEEAREVVRAPYNWIDAASVWDVVEAL